MDIVMGAMIVRLSTNDILPLMKLQLFHTARQVR